jgi:hypothetical protein
MTTVCIASKCLANNAKLGGHIWVYLNWALGCQLAGCRVIFLEAIEGNISGELARDAVLRLRKIMKSSGLNADICLIRYDADQSKYIPEAGIIDKETIHLDEAADEADLLLDIFYGLPLDIISRFRRSALIDIDPGLLQVWMHEGQLNVSPHDIYFTIGETVGQSGSLIPDCGLRWIHTRPPVALESWPVVSADVSAYYTSVTNWWGEWVQQDGEVFDNQKRSSFIKYVDLPRHTDANLELAIFNGPGMDDDRAEFTKNGWSIRNSEDVSNTPRAYQDYIQGSRGEFSCAKPSCMRFQNAWISDRTLCYLASGKPAVVEHTGKSSFLPNGDGLFRFRNQLEAIRAFEKIEADYAVHALRARALAEEYFDAKCVVNRVLEQAL